MDSTKRYLNGIKILIIFLGDPPIDAQYALDLIFKTLIDDKKQYPYLATMPESTEQINYIMLELILMKYSRKYRRYIRKKEKGV